MLNTFETHCEEIYVFKHYVYNIHISTYVSDDTKQFEPLDPFSAFPHENVLGQLKKLITSPNRPLQQIHNRLTEMYTSIKLPEYCKSQYNFLVNIFLGLS